MGRGYKAIRRYLLHAAGLTILVQSFMQLRLLPAIPVRTYSSDTIEMERKRRMLRGTASNTGVDVSLSDMHTSGQFKLLMVLYVFGQDDVNKRYFRLFVESAHLAGVDLAIVGHPVPPFPLPPNVRHVDVTWNELVERVSDRMFDGIEPSQLKALLPYNKISGLKPAFAVLFPEVVKGYDWWGHLDKQMILGNLRHFLTPELLAFNDVLCGIDEELPWGPFTMYRNVKVVNDLFLMLSEISVKDGINSTTRMFFVESGGASSGMMTTPRTERFNSSMSGIMENYGDQLGLRWKGAVIPFDWDGRCPSDQRNRKKGRCGECVLTRLPDGSQQRLMATSKGCKKQHDGANSCFEEVGLCQYIQAKKTSLEPSLANDAKMDRLIAEGQFRVSLEEGFSILDSNAIVSSDGELFMNV
jgi:hypothetical protein